MKKTLSLILIILTCTLAVGCKKTCYHLDDLKELQRLNIEYTCTATCTESGYYEYICPFCNGKDTIYCPALGHDYEPATCITYATCKRCGAQNESLGYANHIVKDWKTIKEATCLVDGSKTGKCTVCGKKITEVVKGYHDWNDGNICNTCGKAAENSVCCIFPKE